MTAMFLFQMVNIEGWVVISGSRCDNIAVAAVVFFDDVIAQEKEK